MGKSTSLMVPHYVIESTLHLSGDCEILRGKREVDELGVMIRASCSSRGDKALLRESELLSEQPPEIALVPIELLGVNSRSVLVYEEKQGELLATLVEKEGLEFRDFLQLALSVCQCLQVLRENNWVHGDLRPCHILCDKDSMTTHLLGFSRARIPGVPGLKVDEPSKESLLYTSPEQTGRTVGLTDHRSDLYSLGIIFYELLCGSPPFENIDDPLALAHSHIARKPEALSGRRADIPDVLERIVLKMIEKSPENRYQTAEGLLVDLQRCSETLNNSKIPDFALGTKDYSSRLSVPDHLVGREKQRQQLHSAFERSVSGRPSLVTITGKSGTGKSSLVMELRNKVVEKKGHFIFGKFESLRENIPYAAVNQSLSSFVHQVLSLPTEGIEIWKETITEALGKNASVITDVVPDFKMILGEQPKAPELPPQEAKNRFHLVFARLMQAISHTQSPLVWVFDDLQWVDTASLDLFEALFKQTQSSCLLIITIFRDNEVPEDHPLRTLLEQESVPIVAEKIHISLGSLDPDETTMWLSQCLEATKDHVQNLAVIFHKRTGGNPFFLRSLLLSIYEQDLIERDHNTGQWTYDIDLIGQTQSSDDIADHLAERLARLPETTRNILSIASCFGSRFDLQTLSVILDEDIGQNIEEYLAPAIDHGLIWPVRDSSPFMDRNTTSERFLQFTHDRVEKASYQLLSPEKRKKTHVKIARSMFQSLDEHDPDPKIFSITDHYNIGQDYLESQSEKYRVAELNQRSGARAVQSVAYKAAFHYFEEGIQLLGPEKWQKKRSLTQKLLLGSAQSSLQLIKFEQAKDRIEEGLRNAQDVHERTHFHFLQIRMYTILDERVKAIDLARKVLAELGFSLPKNPGTAHLLKEALLTQRMVKSFGEKKILRLSPLDDPVMAMAMEMLVVVGTAVYLSQPNLLPFISMKVVQFSLKHGMTSASPYAFLGYAMVLCAGLGFIKEGTRVAILALELQHSVDPGLFRAKIDYAFRVCIQHWTEPLRDMVEALSKTRRLALESGDFEVAVFASADTAVNRFFLGQSLRSAQAAFRSSIEEARNRQVLITLRELSCYEKLLEIFIGKVAWQDGLTELYELEPKIGKENVEWRSTWFDYSLARFIFAFHFGHNEQGFEFGKLAQEMLETRLGLSVVPEFQFYLALNSLALARKSTGIRRNGLILGAKRALGKLKKWTKHCENNFLFRVHLIEAELNFTTKKQVQAIALYEKAAQLALREGFLQHGALAHELFARFFLENHTGLAAPIHFKKASEIYKQWGALGKVDYLRKTYPEWLDQIKEQEHKPTISRTSTLGKPRKFDLESIVKASQTISGEILLEKLARKVMAIVLESAGARRGCLIIVRDQEQFVVAPQRVDEKSLPKLEIPLGDYKEIALSVVSHVLKTQEDVVLGDALEDARFGQDPWLVNGKIRSLLCIPIIKSSDVLGALYLENELTENAFVSERVELLRILSGQIAISLENAILYRDLQDLNETLEQKVEERTSQLKRAQKELLEKAHKAGMADVATQVLHNIGNLLNSVCTSASLIRDSVRNSELHRVNSVEKILPEESEELDTFISIDKRAPTVLKFYLNLGRALRKEREIQDLEAERLLKGLDSITEAVSAQQQYAEAPKFSESVNLSNVIEDAIKLCSATFAAHNINVVRQEEPVPDLDLHRSKMVQVLVELIENAKDALKDSEDRRITFSTLEKDGCTELKIEDNGKGIENLEKIFGYGFTTKSHARGNGLHQAANQVREMGGKLRAESRGIGQGATFVVTFAST